MDSRSIFNQNLPADLNQELIRLSNKLEAATEDLEARAVAWASAEHTYRKAKATAYLKFKTDSTGTRHTIPVLEAIVDNECEGQRFDAYLARAQREAASERVKSLRAMLSALQSVTASVRAEIELTKY